MRVASSTRAETCDRPIRMSQRTDTWPESVEGPRPTVVVSAPTNVSRLALHFLVQALLNGAREAFACSDADCEAAPDVETAHALYSRRTADLRLLEVALEILVRSDRPVVVLPLSRIELAKAYERENSHLRRVLAHDLHDEDQLSRRRRAMFAGRIEGLIELMHNFSASDPKAA